MISVSLITNSLGKEDHGDGFPDQSSQGYCDQENRPRDPLVVLLSL